MRELRKLVGDVHGKYGRFNAIMKSSACPIIQVGDMGVGFVTRLPDGHLAYSNNPSHDAMVAGGHRFIRGNHDNPEVCARHDRWIPDGTVERIGESTVMLVGGAWSIDRAWRTEGIDWWADEQLSDEQLQRLLELHREKKPDVMITHDAPMTIAHALFLQGTHKPICQTRTGHWLDMMLIEHRPRLWVFGHWHASADVVINGCRFVCLNELEDRDFEL